jgi:hypothetical protein
MSASNGASSELSPGIASVAFVVSADTAIGTASASTAAVAEEISINRLMMFLS